MTHTATDPETIVAVATAVGAGGIGIVRISGARALAIARELCRRDEFRPRHAHRVSLHQADLTRIDDGLALYFPGPNSYTGEDVVELHGHGSPVVLALLVEHAQALGARHARPGEYSERAFINGKLDLVQAEAVADLIAAGSAAAARAALRSLDGAFSRHIASLQQGLEGLRVEVEAAIDFADEPLELEGTQGLRTRFSALRSELAQLRAVAARGRRLRDGARLVLVGAPNVGKSSLLNALAHSEVAIVTPIAGTTRDVLTTRLDFDGLVLEVLDTAGLRDSVDPVEQQGVARARKAAATADLLLHLIDDTDPDSAAVLAPEVEALAVASGAAVLRVYTKADLSGRPCGPLAATPNTPAVRVCAPAGQGLDALRERARELLGLGAATTGEFSARARHLDALTRAAADLELAAQELELGAMELAGEALRLTQQSLAEITGEYRPDDLLGAIFSTFCIGK